MIWHRACKDNNLIAVLALAGLVSFLVAGTPALPKKLGLSPAGTPLTPKEHELLGKGEVLTHLVDMEGTPVKQATTLGVINAPPAQVYKTVTNYDNIPNFMPYVTKTSIEKRQKEMVWGGCT